MDAFLFVFSTQAMHLEVCDFMNCDSFLYVFFRFFHLHGEATRQLWCDNGTNLKAGGSEFAKSIKMLNWKNDLDKLSPKGVE